MKLIKLIFIIIVFAFIKVKASVHAGNITYSWLYGYSYQIKYTLYTDNVSPDNYCQIDSICFGDGTRGSILRSNGPCNGPCSPNGCEGQALPGAIYKTNEYITSHNFPGPGIYKLCLEVPNRSVGVINLPNSMNQTFYVESFLLVPTFGSSKNTSTVFGNPPLANGCSNNGCYTYNPLATDMDGDSLSYEIAMCKSHGGATTPGYAYPSAGAGGTFSINPVTGELSWCNPQLSGIYNVVIIIKEWRMNDDGTYFVIGYVERDTQLSVETCAGIKEEQNKSTVCVFPNPVSENLLVVFSHNNHEAFRIELMDLAGRYLKTLASQEYITKENTIDLNLEYINPGIYFLKIIGNQTTFITKKIIKQ